MLRFSVAKFAYWTHSFLQPILYVLMVFCSQVLFVNMTAKGRMGFLMHGMVVCDVQKVHMAYAIYSQVIFLGREAVTQL